MPFPNPMHLIKPLSRSHLAAVHHNFADPVKMAALIANMPWDYHYDVHDFTQAIQTAEWTAVNAGTAPTDFAYNAQRNGALRGATGTTADNVIALHKAQTYFDADDNPFMIVRWLAPAAVTSFVFEIGFSDPKSTEAAVSVTDIDTPTVGNGVTDGVFVALDTAQTLTTAALVSVGTTDAAAKSDIGTYTPTVDTWQVTLIGVKANKAFCSIFNDGSHVGRFSLASGPDGAVLMRPSLVFKTLNTTTKQIDVDLIVLGSERLA